MLLMFKLFISPARRRQTSTRAS